MFHLQMMCLNDSNMMYVCVFCSLTLNFCLNIWAFGFLEWTLCAYNAFSYLRVLLTTMMEKKRDERPARRMENTHCISLTVIELRNCLELIQIIYMHDVKITTATTVLWSNVSFLHMNLDILLFHSDVGLSRSLYIFRLWRLVSFNCMLLFGKLI